MSWERLTGIGGKEMIMKVQAARQKDDRAFHVEALEFSLCLPSKSRD